MPTKQNTTTGPVEDEQNVTGANTSGTGQQDTGEDNKGKANEEAARYRRQLRDTEQERDTLTASVDGLRKQLVAQNMPASSHLGADALWTAGRNPADLFNSAGQLDTEKLRDTVKEVSGELGVVWGADRVAESGSGSGGLREEPASLAGQLRAKKGQ